MGERRSRGSDRALAVSEHERRARTIRQRTHAHRTKSHQRSGARKAHRPPQNVQETDTEDLQYPSALEAARAGRTTPAQRRHRRRDRAEDNHSHSGAARHGATGRLPVPPGQPTEDREERQADGKNGVHRVAASKLAASGALPRLNEPERNRLVDARFTAANQQSEVQSVGRSGIDKQGRARGAQR